MVKPFQKIFSDTETRAAVGCAQPVTIELRPDDRRDTTHFATRGFTRKPPLIDPGGFDVFVNGVQWGRTSPESQGIHGTVHYVYQMTVAGGCHRAYIEVPRVLNPRFGGQTSRHAFAEWSDKHYLRRGGSIPAPLHERIANRVVEAIQRGGLRDPAVIERETRAKSDQRREAEAALLVAEKAEWESKAREAIGPYAYGMAPGVVADLTARIVEAMKWAQSK